MGADSLHTLSPTLPVPYRRSACIMESNRRPIQIHQKLYGVLYSKKPRKTHVDPPVKPSRSSRNPTQTHEKTHVDMPRGSYGYMQPTQTFQELMKRPTDSFEKTCRQAKKPMQKHHEAHIDLLGYYKSPHRPTEIHADISRSPCRYTRRFMQTNKMFYLYSTLVFLQT